MGGTSSRSYFEIGLWDKVLADIKPGDFVLMQFGHNDNGKYAIKNNSEDTLHYIDPKTGNEVVVHSYGWNLRKYISEAKVKGAIPIVLSLVPRNIWKEGKVNRSTNDFTLWARQAADDKDTEAKVKSTYFGTDHVHTLEAGAKVNAACVIEGLLQLKGKPFKKYINKKVWREY
jgi:hypothetical protein